MVMNSFGREISCSKWEGPSMHTRCLAFFLLSLGWWGEYFFSFFPGSQCVLTMFPIKFSMGSHQVPNMFSKLPICSPTCCPQHLAFIPYALANVVLLSPIQVGQRVGILYFKIEPSILGNPHGFMFFSDGPIKLAHCNKKNLNLGGTSSNNRRGVEQASVQVWRKNVMANEIFSDQ